MYLRTTLILAAMLVIAGCDLSAVDPGGGMMSQTTVSFRGSVAPGDAPAADSTAPASPVATGEPGAFSGIVLLSGQVPVLAPKVAMGSSKVDGAVCAADGAIPDESLIVGSNGGISNVFIYLDKKPAGFAVDAASTNPELDQKGCIFKPHALVLRTGTPFLLKNSDPVAHNVQTFPKLNPSMNSSMAAGSTAEVVYKKPEPTPFSAKCAIHPWMEYWTLVVDHPFVAVTDAEGKFKISGLPPGKHKFRIWQERAQILDKGYTVEIAGGQEKNVEIKFDSALFAK